MNNPLPGETMSMDLNLHRVANIFIGEPKEFKSNVDGVPYRYQQVTIIDADGARNSINLYLGDSCPALPANLPETFLHPLKAVPA